MWLPVCVRVLLASTWSTPHPTNTTIRWSRTQHLLAGTARTSPSTMPPKASPGHAAGSHVGLAAMAAKQTGRPVRLVLERPQMFGMVGNRPFTDQHIQISARDDGTLTGMRHDVISTTSTFEDWNESSAILTRMLYAVPNQATTHKLVKLDVGTPTFMRAPGETSGSFALESAMDEMAYQLNIDPLAFRLKNYAEMEPQEKRPWSEKSLRECYRT